LRPRSRWRISRYATSGALPGSRARPFATAYVVIAADAAFALRDAIV
jgi:hypothetical protein